MRTAARDGSRFLKHPIAMIVNLRHRRRFENSATSHWSCIWQEKATDNNRVIRYVPELHGADDILDQLAPNTDYVVFGSPRPIVDVDPPFKAGKKPEAAYYNLKIDLYSSKQFAPLYP